MVKQFWLMKSEPDSFGIADLARVKLEPWTGVRSYFARAHMRAMSVGDPVLFHHSSATPPGVAGLARVARTQVVDETQFDPASKYYEPKATREAPIWDCVEVEYVETLPHFVSMDRMRGEPALADMMVLRRGMRLSVQPVTEAEYETVVALGHTAPAEPARASPRAPAPRPRGRAAKSPPRKTARSAAQPRAARRATAKQPARATARATPATRRAQPGTGGKRGGKPQRHRTK